MDYNHVGEQIYSCQMGWTQHCKEIHEKRELKPWRMRKTTKIFVDTVWQITDRSLKKLCKWAKYKGLDIIPTKTEIVIFTKEKSHR